MELQGPKEHIAVWLEILGQPSLLDSPAHVVKLGVFNQWISAGPVSLHSGRLTATDLDLDAHKLDTGCLMSGGNRV